MRNTLIAGLTAALLSVSSVAPVFAGQYSDSNKISDWSAEHIEILTELGVIVGYPDGTFRPAENITREEMAVMLLEGMIVLENYILDTVWNNDMFLYEELVYQQTQLLSALAAIDEMQAKEVLEKNNFVAIGFNYSEEEGDIDDININAKIQVIEISDNFAISVRPFVDTTSTVGSSVTLDADVLKDVELFAGVGAAYDFDQNGIQDGITGFNEDVVGFGHVGVSYDVSKDVVIILDGKIPFTNNEGEDVQIGLSAGWKF